MGITRVLRDRNALRLGEAPVTYTQEVTPGDFAVAIVMTTRGISFPIVCDSWASLLGCKIVLLTPVTGREMEAEGND